MTTKHSELQLKVFSLVHTRIGRPIDLVKCETFLPTTDEIVQMGVEPSAKWLVTRIQYLDMTKSQQAVVDGVRRKLWGEQIYTMSLDGLPTGPAIKKMGIPVAMDNLYWSSIFWDKMLCP